jgi:hypothetical protein
MKLDNLVCATFVTKYCTQLGPRVIRMVVWLGVNCVEDFDSV